jgi:hypothetical protein
MARRIGWLALGACACVGSPPSPPPQAAGSTTSGSGGDDTTVALETTGASMSHTATDTTQGVEPGTSTGEVATTGDPATTGGVATTSGPSTGDGPGSTGASLTCDELFGAAPGYILCMETPDACHFSAITGGGNCDQLCATFGSVCLGAFDNNNVVGQECTVIRPSMDTCATYREVELCVCAK